MSSAALPAMRPLIASVSSSSRAPAGIAQRCLSTSAPARAASGRDRNLGDWDMARMPDFQFDDATSHGHLRLQKLEEARNLIWKAEADKPVLRAQAKKFTPPAAPIRLTATLDLSDPTSSYHAKRVLVAPVSSLPLSTPEAIHRVKLLAGPRWTPGYPGRHEGEAASGSHTGVECKDGWIKIAEERFREPRMNRKSVSDMLERLVDAANDPKSPLPADTPLDPRHLLARQRRKRQRSAAHVWARAEALKDRPVIGGVRGFPAEWLPGQA